MTQLTSAAASVSLYPDPKIFQWAPGTASDLRRSVMEPFPAFPNRSFLVFAMLTAQPWLDPLFYFGTAICFQILQSDPRGIGPILELRSADDAEEWISTTWFHNLLRAFIVSTGLENVFTAARLIRDY